MSFEYWKTGVTPLPDNDSRDTYCYEIHVHTGFIRGAGTSAEVSIVLTGGLEETEPRVLKDPNRKNFKTGLYFFVKTKLKLNDDMHGAQNEKKKGKPYKQAPTGRILNLAPLRVSIAQ